MMLVGSQAVTQERFDLPAPRLEGGATLEEVLEARRSVREFSPAPLSPGEAGQLLWAAQGVTDSEGRRTAPSAGALYPLELYLVVGRVDGLAAGIYHYDPVHHRLARRVEGERRDSLANFAHGQSCVAGSAAVVVITGVESRLARKYGERAARYMTLEAGHAAQNLLLQATALALAAVPVGAFDDGRIAAELRLPEGERPLYLVPVGRP